MFDAIVMEWGGLLLRWVHIITGIAWIGSSFYFMHIDASLKTVLGTPPGKGGEAWEVHGGGFYHVRKYMVAPEKLPDQLIWHKWEAYSTWVSGFFLLIWIYYLGSDLYLIDPDVRQMSPGMAAAVGIGSLVVGWLVYNFLVSSALAKNELALAAVGFGFIMAVAWFFQQMFSGRGALIHTGAMMGTIMSGNVAMNIIPNQKKVIADLIAGRVPNPEYGQQAKTRSRHNNYLTLPVLYCMISGHYPLTFTSPYAWVMVGFVLIAGAAVRYYYNERHAGRGDAWWAWGVAAASVLAAIGISMLSNPAGREKLGLKALKPPLQLASGVRVPQAVDDIITSRCSMCHATEPVWNGIVTPPKGVMLDTQARIWRQSDAIRIQAVLTNAMPPNNITQMTRDERRVLAAWLQTK
jgi:uncharacterized membrane protein